jgi:hypothetical protein
MATPRGNHVRVDHRDIDRFHQVQRESGVSRSASISPGAAPVIDLRERWRSRLLAQGLLTLGYAPEDVRAAVRKTHRCESHCRRGHRAGALPVNLGRAQKASWLPRSSR